MYEFKSDPDGECKEIPKCNTRNNLLKDIIKVAQACGIDTHITLPNGKRKRKLKKDICREISEHLSKTNPQMPSTKPPPIPSTKPPPMPSPKPSPKPPPLPSTKPPPMPSTKPSTKPSPKPSPFREEKKESGGCKEIPECDTRKNLLKDVIKVAQACGIDTHINLPNGKRKRKLKKDICREIKEHISKMKSSEQPSEEEKREPVEDKKESGGCKEIPECDTRKNIIKDIVKVAQSCGIDTHITLPNGKRKRKLKKDICREIKEHISKMKSSEQPSEEEKREQDIQNIKRDTMNQLKEKIKERRFQIEKKIIESKFKNTVLSELLKKIESKNKKVDKKLDKNMKDMKDKPEKQSRVDKLKFAAKELENEKKQISEEKKELQKKMEEIKEEKEVLEGIRENIIDDEKKVEKALSEGDVIEEVELSVEQYLEDTKIFDISELVKELDEIQDDERFKDISNISELDKGILACFGLLSS